MTLAVAAKRVAGTFLSGPVGGVTGATRVAEMAGLSDIITFDMGGTSTDVALVHGLRARMSYDNQIDAYPLQMPQLDMHTIGAGGGSIVWIGADGTLQIGPHSAGALPGPACYGRGGTRRPCPMPTCCSAACRRRIRSAAACDSTARWPSGHSQPLGRGARHRAISCNWPTVPCASPLRKWQVQCGKSRFIAASPARFHPRWLRRRRADAHLSCRRRAGHRTGDGAPLARSPMCARPDAGGHSPRRGVGLRQSTGCRRARGAAAARKHDACARPRPVAGRRDPRDAMHSRSAWICVMRVSRSRYRSTGNRRRRRAPTCDGHSTSGIARPSAMPRQTVMSR
jgi:hypothetical protein